MLVGPEAELTGQVAALGMDAARITYLDAKDKISSDESPVQAIRKKKDSTIVKGLQAVADGQAEGFVSAGSTGAVLAGATFIIHRIPGIARPALAPVLPTQNGGGAVLIDCGANVDCQPEYLHQFALMGQAYMTQVMGVDKPKTGLINNGAEEEKGNDLVKKSFALIRQDSRINFMGSIEARDVLSGNADVLVCDGFIGNMVLKSIEGTAGFMMKELKAVFYASMLTKLAALILKKRLGAFRRKLDYTEYGGAPFLGVNGKVMKSHGSSNVKAIKNAVLKACSYARSTIVEQIKTKFESMEVGDVE
jgi:glycerol-3-phosphate acyltransferase PlsX